MERSEYLLYIADMLLNYKSKPLVSPAKKYPKSKYKKEKEDETRKDTIGFCSNHNIIDCDNKQRCMVCKLEETRIEKVVEGAPAAIKETVRFLANKLRKLSKTGSRKKVSMCSTCGLCAHNFQLETGSRFLHGLLDKKTCMDIIHSQCAMEIWNLHGEGRTRVTVNPKDRTVIEVYKLIGDRLGVPYKEA